MQLQDVTSGMMTIASAIMGFPGEMKEDTLGNDRLHANNTMWHARNPMYEQVVKNGCDRLNKYDTADPTLKLQSKHGKNT